jgi:flagellar biosynthesis/type III secretory pathway protein FliH
MKTLCIRFSSKLSEVRLFPTEEQGGSSFETSTLQANRQATPCHDPILERVQKEQMEREAVQRVFQSVERTLPELHSLVQTRLDHWAPYVLDLALRLAGEALGRELDAGNYDLVLTIREALSQEVGAGEGSLQVFLNPLDLGRVLERIGEEGEGVDLVQKEVDYKVDPSVPPGSCRIESNHGRIVHDPRTVLDAMVQKIWGELGS